MRRLINKTITILMTAAMIVPTVALSNAWADEIDDNNVVESEVMEEQSEDEVVETVDLSEYLFQEGGFTTVYPELPEHLKGSEYDQNDATNPNDSREQYSDDEILPEVNTVTLDSQGIYKYIYQQIKNRNERIYLRDYNIKLNSNGTVEGTNGTSWYNYFSAVINEYPDLYYVSPAISLSRSGDYVYSITLGYSNKFNDSAFNAETEKALSVIKPGMSDVDKAIALHDYLALNITYGGIDANCYNAYGALVDHVAVCQGYALAYKHLLNKAGITAFMVTSSAMDHAWNLVELGGKLYQVDVTWDDPLNDMLGRAMHSYMFLSDAEFRTYNDRHEDHYGWTVAPGISGRTDLVATSTLYDNAYWSSINSALVFHYDGGNPYYYYMQYSNGSIGIRRISSDFSTAMSRGATVIYGNVPRWGTWIGCWGNVYEANGRLYFNTPTGISSVTFSGTDYKVHFTASLSGNEKVYGSVLRDGKVYYAIDTSPGHLAKQTYLIANVGSISSDIPVSYAFVNEFSIINEGYMAVDFFVELPSNVYSIKINNPEGGTTTYTVAGNLAAYKVEENIYRIHRLLYPRKMSEQITISAYDSRGNRVNFGNKNYVSNGEFRITGHQLMGTMYNYAVSQGKQELMLLCKYTDIYSEYAEKYFNGSQVYNDLDQLPAQSLSYINSQLMIMSIARPAGITYAGITLTLRQGIDMNVYFSIQNGLKPSDYTFKVDGKEVQCVESSLNPGLYCVKIANIAACDLDVQHAVVVSRKGSYEEPLALQMNALTYLGKALNSNTVDQDLKDLMVALFNYYCAAELYYEGY